MIYFQINYYEAIIIWNSNILLSFCCYVNTYSTRSLKASEDHERKDMQIWNYSFLWNHYHVPFTLICGLVRLSAINEFKCVTSAIFLWSYLLRIKKSALSEKVNCLLYTIRKICFIFTGMCATMVLKFNSEPQQISEYFQFQFNKTMLYSFLK